MIRNLKLTNFRKFKKLELDFDSQLVVIHGNNTKGKSSILEAIYMLTNGHSPWAETDDVYNYNQKEDQHFRAQADIEREGETKTYALFRDGQKRVLQLNDQKTTGKKFFENISSIIFNPEQIEILMISPSKRRDFIDDILSKIDIEYSDLLSKFRKVLRQRNAYLKKLSKRFFDTGQVQLPDKQLEYWTDEFAKCSAAMISKRAAVIDELKTDEFTLHYRSTLSMNLFEDMSDLESLAKIHYNALMNKVKPDVAVGHTRIGAHRDDWAIFNGKDVKRFGSRGEKRIAIIKLIFRTQQLVTQKKGYLPYLLLDDIPSELDSINTKLILDPKVLSRQQSFITTINIDLIPKTLLKKAQIIDLNRL
jgi:DNA replication and repair protein RecF